MGTRNDIKYSILEKDGEEYVGPHEHIPLSRDVSFSADGFTADNLEDGVIEAKSDAIAAAGFAILGSTTSTAGVGKYLNIFGTTSSDILPFPILSNTILVEAGIRATVATTVVIGVYKLVEGVETLLTALDLNNSTKHEHLDLDLPVMGEQDIVMKVTSGSANKPSVALIFRRA